MRCKTAPLHTPCLFLARDQHGRQSARRLAASAVGASSFCFCSLDVTPGKEHQQALTLWPAVLPGRYIMLDVDTTLCACALLPTTFCVVACDCDCTRFCLRMAGLLFRLSLCQLRLPPRPFARRGATCASHACTRMNLRTHSACSTSLAISHVHMSTSPQQDASAQVCSSISSSLQLEIC
jgi:hypothetical protein